MKVHRGLLAGVAGWGSFATQRCSEGLGGNMPFCQLLGSAPLPPPSIRLVVAVALGTCTRRCRRHAELGAVGLLGAWGMEASPSPQNLKFEVFQ